jgi:glycosyltransferase involved in cell wall biosynthesis
VDWLRQSYKLFRGLEWPRLEWVVAADQDDEPTLRYLAQLERDDPRVRATVSSPRITLGEKRNRGISVAHGDHILSWDDDDWFGTRRVEAQILPIIKGICDVTGLPHLFHLNLVKGQLWARDTLPSVVHPATLAFHLLTWEREGRYLDLAIYEDIELDKAFMRTAARRWVIDTRSESPQFVYVRHGRNTSPNTFDEISLTPARWPALRLLHLPAMFDQEDVVFYQAMFRRCQEQQVAMAENVAT